MPHVVVTAAPVGRPGPRARHAASLRGWTCDTPAWPTWPTAWPLARTRRSSWSPTPWRRIEALDPQLNAWVVVDGERALAEAAAIDARVASGQDVGPLAGIPIGVKDLEDAAGFTTGFGSLLHAQDPPAAADSPLVARLRAAGCVVLGKTATPEFGFQGDTTSLAHGPTRNPWDPRALAGRVVGRLGRGAGLGDGAAGHGQRRGRVHPHPGRAVRADRVSRPPTGASRSVGCGRRGRSG